jgi:hypothetical protein
MDEQTTVPTFESETKPAKSRRVIFIAVGILLIAIVVISVVALSNRSGSFLGGFFGKAGVTMVDLQMDYDAWRGNFKSYNENDTVTLRDVVTSLEVVYTPIGEHPITNVYFNAYSLPTFDDLYLGRVQNNSWYSWMKERTGAQFFTIFRLKSNPNPPPTYLPEASVAIQGDIRDRIHVGDLVEVTLFVIRTSTHNPRGWPIWMATETISAFGWAAPPERIRKI